MKLTAQAEYGLRCILSLARARRAAASMPTPQVSERTSLTVGEIAESEGISMEYAGKLIRILRRSGLVESTLGRKGGYCLARPPDQISVCDVLAALGARIYEPALCDRYTGDRTFCVHDSDCAIRSLWAGLQHIIDDVLSKVTLNELVGTEQGMAEWIQDHSAHVEFPPELFAPRCRERPR